MLNKQPRKLEKCGWRLFPVDSQRPFSRLVFLSPGCFPSSSPLRDALFSFPDQFTPLLPPSPSRRIRMYNFLIHHMFIETDSTCDVMSIFPTESELDFFLCLKWFLVLCCEFFFSRNFVQRDLVFFDEIDFSYDSIWLVCRWNQLSRRRRRGKRRTF